jgi:hypothetical protein
MWLERPEQWDKLAEHLRAAGEFGYDTETYGQPDKTSPQHRARVHCWSVGILSGPTGPRGYRRAVGRVLPARALAFPAIAAVLADRGIRKWAHNAPHDRHATENEGVEIRGLEDTLQSLRVLCPGRLDYGLKATESWALGYPSRPSFMDMVCYERDVVHARRRREKGCICGATPCRARSTADFCDVDGVWRPHTRVAWSVFTPIKRKEAARYEVTDFVPGAHLAPLVWQGKTLDRLTEWWSYSLADAVRGMELVDWMRGQKPAKLVYPWMATTTYSLPTVPL